MRSYTLQPPAAAPDPPADPPAAAGVRLVNCGISARNDFLRFIYEGAPVVGFRVFLNDVQTVRAARFPDELAARLEGATRGKIEHLSLASRRRLALVAGNSNVPFRSFVTVTYPREFPSDGALVKKHLHALLQALRRKTGGTEYLWFLEFQGRGAPHLHVFLSAEMPTPHAPMKRQRRDCLTHWPWQKWLAVRWFEIVGSGDPKHLRAGAAWEVVEKADGAARYVAKESYKTFQKWVPAGYQNVGRFWGVSRGVTPGEGKMVYASESEMRAMFPDGVDDDGNPYPLIFSAAETYRAVEGTAADPTRVREWHFGRKGQKEMSLDAESSAPCNIDFDHGSLRPL